jgi:glycosyltransferase involved in cell wall biosynthesis
VRWANAVIADSEATRADLLRLLKIPPERVAVIPLGVRESFKAPILPEEIQRVRHSYNLPEQYLLYTGTIEPRKGLETLIEALCSLVDTFPHYLLIAGKRGWYSNEILSSVVRCGLERRVRLMGYVPDEDLPALYAGADVFVFPSKYEGFGLPPLEAMACGAPVVASNASSLPEVIGDAGILTPPEDAEALAEAIRRVLESTELQEDLRQRGKLRAAQFSWDETARRTLKVYEQVARKGKWIQENQDDRHD